MTKPHYMNLLITMSMFLSVSMFGMSFSLWKVIAWCSAPWSVSRLFIMLYLLVTSMYKLGTKDRLARLQQTNQQME